MADRSSLLSRYILLYWVGEKTPIVLEEMSQIEKTLRMEGRLIAEEALSLFTLQATKTTEERIIIADTP
jgi:hypothetical protein